MTGWARRPAVGEPWHYFPGVLSLCGMETLEVVRAAGGDRCRFSAPPEGESSPAEFRRRPVDAVGNCVICSRALTAKGRKGERP